MPFQRRLQAPLTIQVSPCLSLAPTVSCYDTVKSSERNCDGASALPSSVLVTAIFICLDVLNFSYMWCKLAWDMNVMAKYGQVSSTNWSKIWSKKALI
jgi:hypothetical protein